MIDIESFLFSQIAGALRSTYDGIFVSGEYVDSPAKFPAVTIVESDNNVLQKMRTAAPNLENAVSLMYEVNVYTNSVGYKKSEVRISWRPSTMSFPRLASQEPCAIQCPTCRTPLFTALSPGMRA